MSNVDCADAFAFLERDVLEIVAREAHALDGVFQRRIVNKGAVSRVDETELDADMQCWCGFHTLETVTEFL